MYSFITAPLKGDGFKNLKEGQKVEYVQAKADKGWKAEAVIKLE